CGVRGELGIRGAAGRGDGTAYAACRIRCSGHPVLELVGAVPGEDDVAVAVSETGDHAATVRVYALIGIRRGSGIAGPGDEPVIDDERRVLPLPQLRILCRKETDPVDEDARHAELPSSLRFRPAAASSTQSATRRTVRPSGASAAASTSVRSIETT